VRRGTTIALVGSTGGGKSTIVSLAARFYEPVAGRILVDGVDLRDRGLHWHQSNLGVVAQVPHLFSGSVRENIRYGRLEATDAEVEAAARKVNAHEAIAALDGGYAFEVGEGGERLSIGQRQLVALARAVLRDPTIFILDEATSSVDTATERLLQGGIDAALRDRISFVIAHRLSTIRRADRILVIEAGRIVESGTHDELLARHGRYRELYTRQYAAEREAALLGPQAGP
jgi:ATP-binding cassette subfamily B protein